MAQLFEHMEKMDIQAERRKTEEQRKIAEEQRKKAEEQQRKAEEQQREAEEQQRIAKEQQKKAEQGIKIVIETCRDFNEAKEDTIQRIMKNFNFDRKEAEKNVNLYWKT